MGLWVVFSFALDLFGLFAFWVIWLFVVDLLEGLFAGYCGVFALPLQVDFV